MSQFGKSLDAKHKSNAKIVTVKKEEKPKQNKPINEWIVQSRVGTAKKEQVVTQEITDEDRKRIKAEKNQKTAEQLITTIDEILPIFRCIF